MTKASAASAWASGQVFFWPRGRGSCGWSRCRGEGGLDGVGEVDGVAGAGEDVGDAVAHGAGADELRWESDHA